MRSSRRRTTLGIATEAPEQAAITLEPVVGATPGDAGTPEGRLLELSSAGRKGAPSKVRRGLDIHNTKCYILQV